MEYEKVPRVIRTNVYALTGLQHLCPKCTWGSKGNMACICLLVYVSLISDSKITERKLTNKMGTNTE